jgi:CheY-like chemotaxis protein
MPEELPDSVQCLVVDAFVAKKHWKRLLGPALACFVPANSSDDATSQMDAIVDLADKDLSDLPKGGPTVILINADLHITLDQSSDYSGAAVALRFRQEPGRIHCPIILVSFCRAVDAIEEDKARSAGQLEALLGQRWQARWLRLPAGRETIIDEARAAHEEFSRRVDGQIPAALLRPLSTEICKGLVEYTHKRYAHGRGSFTAALWLLADAVRSGNVNLAVANEIVRAIRNNPGDRPGGSVVRGYDFGLFERLLKSIEAGNPVRPDAALLAIQGRKRKLLLIEDEYGWLEFLERLLPSWTIVQSQGDPEIVRHLADADLVLVDHMLDGKPAGIDKINMIRMHDPVTPTILFTNDRRASLLALAIESGADGIILKQSTDSSKHGTVACFSEFCDVLAQLCSIEPAQLRQLVAVLETTRRHAIAGNEEVWAVSADLGWPIALFALALGLHGPSHAQFTRPAYIGLGDALKGIRSGRARAAQKASNAARHGGSVAADASHLCAVWDHLPPPPPRLPADRPVVKTTRVVAGRPIEHEERADLAVRCLLLGYYAAKGKLRPEHRDLWRSRSRLSESELNAIRSAVELAAEKTSKPSKPHGAAKTLHIVDGDAHTGGLFKVLCLILDSEQIVPSVMATSVLELEQAVETGRVKVDPPDCILLDIGMPIQEGEGRVRLGSASQRPENDPLNLLREEFTDTPVVIFSATENASVVYRCMFRDEHVAYEYFPKIGSSSELDGDDASSIDYLKTYYAEFRKRLDPSPPLLARRELRRFLEVKLKPKLRELEKLDARLSGTDFEKGFRVVQQRISQLFGEKPELSLGSFLGRYIESEFETLHTILWVQELPRTRALIERVNRHLGTTPDDEDSHLMEEYLWVSPAAAMEWLSSLVLAIVTGLWPKRLDWQFDRYPWILLNRGVLTELAGESFNEAWVNVWRVRKARHKEALPPTDTLLASFCTVMELIVDQLLALPGRSAALLPQERRSFHRFGKNLNDKVYEAERDRRVLSGVVVGQKLDGSSGEKYHYVEVEGLDWVGVMKSRPRQSTQRHDRIRVDLIVEYGKIVVRRV